MDLRMPSVNGLFGYRGPASYNRLRVCTNYRGSGGLHFKSEKRSYIFVSSDQPFSVALLVEIHLTVTPPTSCAREASRKIDWEEIPSLRDFQKSMHRNGVSRVCQT